MRQSYSLFCSGGTGGNGGDGGAQGGGGGAGEGPTIHYEVIAGHYTVNNLYVRSALLLPNAVSQQQ
jgi:hypothetical protein